MLIFLCGCKVSESQNIDFLDNANYPIKILENARGQEIKDWQFKDPKSDSIPGISLNSSKVTELLKRKVTKEVVIAVIDMSVDVDHPQLKNLIWKNKNEIPENNKDEDGNGYVDDIHGWNFLGHKEMGSNEFTSYEYTRIIKKYGDRFKNIDPDEVKGTEKELYNNYIKALAKHNERTKYAKNKYENDSFVVDYFKGLTIKFDSIFSKKGYGLKELDSLQKTVIPDSIMKMNIDDMKTMIKYRISLASLKETEYHSKKQINVLLNLNHNDRSLIGDNEEDIKDVFYGNNIVNHNVIRMDHGTLVSGVIAFTVKQMEKIGLKAKIKIMPLTISGYGDENDKDTALAIRYAVDNGANIINISSGKLFSIHKDWVDDAIKYAEKKDVLIVHSAGNEGEDLQNGKILKYPNDNSSNGSEISNNFLNVGASSYNKNGHLIYSSSNYGKLDVDLFAPGEAIYTLIPKEQKGQKKSGTSYATPLVSTVCALLKSYYPKLSVKDIKMIVMNSVVKYNQPTKVNNADVETIEVPFDQLSKSGGILNAYNAFVLAEKITTK